MNKIIVAIMLLAVGCGQSNKLYYVESKSKGTWASYGMPKVKDGCAEFIGDYGRMVICDDFRIVPDEACVKK